MLRRFVSLLVLVGFVTSSVITPSYAQTLVMPTPGSMVGSSDALVPVLIKGLKVHPDNPLLFDFILDNGHSGLKTGSAAFRNESQKLIKYFLAALTIKEDDLWVNLSPYEKERMLTQELGQTELGRDLLAQDYLLKQFTASLIYPEKNLGQKFWDRVYAAAREKFGTADVQVDTFNKVWIMADYARVLERDEAAYVLDAKLKVMLESDYLAEQKAGAQDTSDDLSKQVMRDVIIPEIEKEVNEGANFAPLRQMFYSMILATWYKQALKDALINQVYANKAKVDGVRTSDDLTPEQIYQRYLEAYTKGVFNYIKEEDSAAVPHKYFSGGVAPNFAVKQRMSTQKALKSGDKLNTGDLAMARAGVKRFDDDWSDEISAMFGDFERIGAEEDIRRQSQGIEEAEQRAAMSEFRKIERQMFGRQDQAQLAEDAVEGGSEALLSGNAIEAPDYSFQYDVKIGRDPWVHVAVKIMWEEDRYFAVVNNGRPIYLTGSDALLEQIIAEVKESNLPDTIAALSINDAQKRIRKSFMETASAMDKAMSMRNPFANVLVNNGTITFGKRSFETEKIRLAVNHILANQLRIQKDSNETEMIDLAPVNPELRREVDFLQGNIVGATRLAKEPLRVGDLVTVGLKDSTGEISLVQTAYEIGAWLRKLRRAIRQSQRVPVSLSVDEAMARALPEVTSMERKGDSIDAMLANGWLLTGKFWPKQKITAFQLKGPLSEDPVTIGKEGDLIGAFESNPARVLESLVGGKFDWAMSEDREIPEDVIKEAEAVGLNPANILIEFGSQNGGRGNYPDFVRTAIANQKVRNAYARGIFKELYPDDEVDIATDHLFRRMEPLECIKALKAKGYSTQAAQWMLDTFVLVGQFRLNFQDAVHLRKNLTDVTTLAYLPGGSLNGQSVAEPSSVAGKLWVNWLMAGIEALDRAQDADGIERITIQDKNNSEVYFNDGTVLKANYWGGTKKVTVLTLRLLHQEPRYKDVEGNVTALTADKAAEFRSQMSGVDGAQNSLPVRTSFPDNFLYLRQPPVHINAQHQSVSIHLGQANGDRSKIWALMWLRQESSDTQLLFIQMPLGEPEAIEVVRQLPPMKRDGQDVSNMRESYLDLLLKAVRKTVPTAFEGKTAAELLAVSDKAMSIDRPTGEEGWVKKPEELFQNLQDENPTGEEARTFESSPVRKDDLPTMPDSWERPEVDDAMVHGGIDLNGNKMGLDVDRKGKGVEMTIAPGLLEEFRKGDFTGLEAVIFQIIPLSSPLPILGFDVNGAELKQASADADQRLSAVLRERHEV